MRAFLNKRYSRGGEFGEGFVGIKTLYEHYKDILGDDTSTLLSLSKDIEDRMRVKVSYSYIKHALNVPKNAKLLNPILKVVMPDAQEVKDLSGEKDPSQ